MSAPVAFGAVAICGVMIGWTICKVLDTNRLTLWRDLVSEYKDKLKNESPVQAATRIKALERQLADAQKILAERGRSITFEQQEKFTEFAEPLRNFGVSVACDPLDPEAESFAKQMMQMFLQHGVSCGFSYLQFGPETKNIPIVFIVKDPTHLRPNATALSNALMGIGLQFELKAVTNPSDVFDDVLFLYVGRKKRQTVS